LLDFSLVDTPEQAEAIWANMMNLYIVPGLLVIAAVYLIQACAGPKVTLHGQDVTQPEVQSIAQAARVTEATWVQILNTAEFRHAQRLMAEDDWAIYRDTLAPAMVQHLKALSAALESYTLNPTDLNRLTMLQASAQVQTTLADALAHAARTLGDLYTQQAERRRG
jgi:hypothetical protein